jgi:hypothetical protein
LDGKGFNAQKGDASHDCKIHKKVKPKREFLENMETKDLEYLQRFEDGLCEQLVALLGERKMLGGTLFTVEELTDTWRAAAPEYMADAVPQIADYPMAAIAWAGYFGAGAALLWDKNEPMSDGVEVYKRLRDARGFDEMDEYVGYLMLDSGLRQENIERMEDAMRQCAQIALTAIRKENIEPQSAMAFHVFARTTKVFYTLGASVVMHLMGYHYEKARVELPS